MVNIFRHLLAGTVHCEWFRRLSFFSNQILLSILFYMHVDMCWMSNSKERRGFFCA